MDFKKHALRQKGRLLIPACAFAWTILCGSALAAGKEIVVSADGAGNFKTIQEAVAAVPEKCADRTVIHIKPGTYQGQILVPKGKDNVTFLGDGVGKTILTYSRNVQEPDPAGIGDRYKGYGVVVQGNGFRAENLTFENTSGDHGQAIALRTEGDKTVIERCRLLGWQDTLMVYANRQYFKDCYIEGRVDFIYGGATAVFDRCEIHSKNGGYVTAANTAPEKPFGFVFLDCKLTGDPAPWVDPAGTAPRSPSMKTYLGRPWRPHASVTFIRCEMGDHILPEGWHNWKKPEAEATVRYSEFGSTGPGGRPDQRVKWSRQLSKAEADMVTVESVLAGDDGWDPAK